jgi:branched-chain amino acid transport system substrate-binding protein
VAARPDDGAALVVAARATGLQRTTIVGDSAFNSPRFLSQAGAAAEGAVAGAGWSAEVPNAKSREFVQHYRDRYGEDPDLFAAQAYAGVTILVDALQRAKTSTDRRALRDALVQVKDVDTVLGRFSFTSSGDARRAAVVQVVRGGQWHLLGPDEPGRGDSSSAGSSANARP